MNTTSVANEIISVNVWYTSMASPPKPEPDFEIGPRDVNLYLDYLKLLRL